MRDGSIADLLRGHAERVELLVDFVAVLAEEWLARRPRCGHACQGGGCDKLPLVHGACGRFAVYEVPAEAYSAWVRRRVELRCADCVDDTTGMAHPELRRAKPLPNVELARRVEAWLDRRKGAAT